MKGHEVRNKGVELSFLTFVLFALFVVKSDFRS